MQILLTGSAGFIAGYLVPELLEASLQLSARMLRALDLPAEAIDRAIERARHGDYAIAEEILPEPSPGAEKRPG